MVPTLFVHEWTKSKCHFPFQVKIFTFSATNNGQGTLTLEARRQHLACLTLQREKDWPKEVWLWVDKGSTEVLPSLSIHHGSHPLSWQDSCHVHWCRCCWLWPWQVQACWEGLWNHQKDCQWGGQRKKSFISPFWSKNDCLPRPWWPWWCMAG